MEEVPASVRLRVASCGHDGTATQKANDVLMNA